jgi:hypothetical protein
MRTRSLLDDYTTERMIADRHGLDVSDRVHRAVIDIADLVRQGREVPAEVSDSVETALLCNARAMIDVDYSGSPLVADHDGSGSGAATQPHPGQRYSDWTRFGGTSHHLLVFGPVADAERLAWLDRRWSRLVQVSQDPDVDPLRAGIPKGGVVLVRPDGHIGFRFSSANGEALATLDRHLSSYLVPNQTVSPDYH